jgi:hypothetical protein
VQAESQTPNSVFSSLTHADEPEQLRSGGLLVREPLGGAEIRQEPWVVAGVRWSTALHCEAGNRATRFLAASSVRAIREV